MPARGCDVAVVGLGAMGSAAACHLARRGARVLGLDRFAPPHAFGSSHGDTRITRKAIGEGEAYVPLVLRSYELWRELEAETGESLLTVTGGLWISSAERKAETHVRDFFDNTVAAARRFAIPHELLDADEIRRGFPQFRVAGNEVGYYEPDAGYLRPEACVAAHLARARALGAELRFDEEVTGLEPHGGGVRVTTASGAYDAGHVVLAAGAWVTRLVEPTLASLFTLTRQVLCWFDVEASHAAFAPPRFPVWIWELQDRAHVIYGFPAIDGPRGGLKVATEQYRTSIRPEALDAVERRVSGAEAAQIHRELVAPYLPGVGARVVKAATCLYTATPDFQFVIDRHPRLEHVTIASPCSGHGFKHSAAIGEALAALALGEAPRVDLSSFALSRFERAGRW